MLWSGWACIAPPPPQPGPRYRCPMQVAHRLRPSTFRKWRSPQRLGPSLPASQPQCPALNLGGAQRTTTPLLTFGLNTLEKVLKKVTKRKPRPSIKPVCNFCAWVMLPADFCYKIKMKETLYLVLVQKNSNSKPILSWVWMEMKFTSLSLCGQWLIHHA